MGTTPEALGNVTASKMMEKMSPNGDGRISPRDFGWWLSDEGNSSDVIRSAAEGFGCDSPGDDTDSEEEAQANRKVQREGENVHTGLWGDQLEGQGHVVVRARKLLCLDCFNVNDLLEILAEAEVMVSLESAQAPVNEITSPPAPEASRRHRRSDLWASFQNTDAFPRETSSWCFQLAIADRETGQSGPG